MTSHAQTSRFNLGPMASGRYRTVGPWEARSGAPSVRAKRPSSSRTGVRIGGVSRGSPGRPGCPRGRGEVTCVFTREGVHELTICCVRWHSAASLLVARPCSPMLKVGARSCTLRIRSNGPARACSRVGSRVSGCVVTSLEVNALT
jgi:hypothetical protein